MTRPLIQVAEVNLGRQRSPQHERGDYMTPYLRSANIGDGVLLLDDVKEMNFPPRDRQAFSLRDGDVLVTEGSGSRATVGQSAVWREELPGMVCFQNTLLRLRPRVGVTDGRYLAWWARHAHSSGLIGTVASGANILHLSAEELRVLPVPTFDLAKQRRIADFLDDQVARIDYIVAGRARQLVLLAQSQSLAIDAVLWNGAIPAVPLKYLVQPITSGPRGWGDLVADAGRPFLRIGNLPANGIRLKLDDLARVLVEDSAETRRATVTEGDILVGITASLGNVGLVPHGLEGATLSQHVARLRPLRATVRPEWLAWVMQSGPVRANLTTSGYGGTKVGLGLAEVGSVRLPDTDFDAQARTAALAASAWQQYEDLRHAIASSSEQHQELKRSLITAAVLGELDVSMANGSRVPV